VVCKPDIQMSGEEGQVSDASLPPGGEELPLGTATSDQPSQQSESSSGDGLHPLTGPFLKNPTAVVDGRTQIQIYEMYRTVAACLDVFVKSDHAAADSTSPKAEQHACFLLQCAAFLSLHILRPSGAGTGLSGGNEAADNEELVTDMTDRVLAALEWAGRMGSSSAGGEAIKALSVLCSDKNITQETMMSASDKIHAHRTVPLEELLVSAGTTTAESRPVAASRSVHCAGLSPLLSRLTRTLATPGV